MHRHSLTLAFTALLALATCTKTNNNVGSVERDSGVGGQASQSGGATTTSSGAGGHSSVASGGVTAFGGTQGSGGAPSLGGNIGSGGAPLLGGNIGSGGAPLLGGNIGSGGSTATGGASGSGGQVDRSAGQTCTYNGKTYPYATTWPSTDGCHECWCQGSNGVCDVGPPCDGGVQSGPSCPYDGKSYPTGATFPSTDGCNSCECLWKWTPGVACTLKDCSGSPIVDALPPIDATADACLYNGTTYPLDAHFQSADRCNYCHCRADGQVTCTLRQDCLQDAGVPGEDGTINGGVCTWPAGFTPIGDENAVGCWAHTVPGPVDASQMACSSAEYALGCVGDIQRFDSGCQVRTMPAPDSSLGCRLLPLPTPSNSSLYCCPCGQSQTPLADASVTMSSGCP